MTKKNFKTSSVALGLALLLVGSGINQAKANLDIQWPNTSDYDDKPFEVYVLEEDGGSEKKIFTEGHTKQGEVSSDFIHQMGSFHDWSKYTGGKIQVTVNSKEKEGISFYIPMSAWNKTGDHQINTILNDTKLVLDGTSYTGTVTYPK